MQDTRLKRGADGKRVKAELFSRLASSSEAVLTKILLVQFRNGEAVHKHPELKSLLREGWVVRSAVPRLVESEGTRLLVVLTKPSPAARAAVLRESERTMPTQAVRP